MFGADGRLYISSGEMGEVIRYDALAGAVIDMFVEEGSGGLGEPTFIIFAPTGKNAWPCRTSQMLDRLGRAKAVT